MFKFRLASVWPPSGFRLDNASSDMNGLVTREGPFWDMMAGELLDDSGQIVATATATAQIRAARAAGGSAA